MLLDTHFHLDLMNNMQALVREFSTTDVGAVVVGTTPKAYEGDKRFCFGTEKIRVGLGMHPQLVAERGQELELFLRLVKGTKYIGEVGLDFNTNYIASKEQQMVCFREIVKACANEGGKVLSIHSAKAARTVIDELKNARAFRGNVCILHWFTGSAAERKSAIESGAYFSINSKMLKTKSGQETIKVVPAERILLETDAPFTMRFRSVSELKTELERLVIGISEIRGVEMRRRIEENSMRVLS